MTEVDRDIALALLKQLKDRKLITEEHYRAACHSRFFDSKHFVQYANPDDTNNNEEDLQHGY